MMATKGAELLLLGILGKEGERPTSWRLCARAGGPDDRLTYFATSTSELISEAARRRDGAVTAILSERWRSVVKAASCAAGEQQWVISTLI